MKFYAEPNMLVRPRKNGPYKRLKPFRFDENGEYETDNPLMIKALSKRFKSENVEIVEEVIELTEEEIRHMAKEKGIKSWHVKKIETLKEELGGIA